jgi:F-type H+-transporting ATPase subunit a
MSSYKRKITKYLIPSFLVFFFIGYATLKMSYAQHEHATDSTTHVESEHDDAVPLHEEHMEENETHAENTSHEETSSKFDPGKMIMEHIGDAHDWHIATIGHSHISIPLPVIIKDDKGLHIFSSSRFHHGHEAYEGYKLEENKIVAVNADGSVNHEASFYDLSITKNVAAMFISVFVLCFILLSIASRYKNNALKAPKGIQGLLEPLIIFLRDEVVKPSVGPKYEKFLPYLLTIFFFIFINNLFGLIPFFPGGANVTGNIAVTMVLALFTFVITSFNGNKGYWAHIFMPPGVPGWLLPLMIPIEIIGMFNKPIVLMIRLFANITAGHIIILGFFSLVFIFAEMSTGLGFGVSAFSVAFTVFMNMLELLVAFLQAYVFTLLSSLYFGAAVEEHHSEHH